MQSFRHHSKLPGTTHEIIQAITTREYLMYRYEDPDLHHLHIEISQRDDDGFACMVSRSGSTDKLPSIARKVVGDKVTLVQEQSWQGWESPVKGHLHFHLHGIPGHVHVDLVLRDDDNGNSVLEAEGQVTANLPLIGGRIEKMLIGRAEEAFVKSADAIREYLQQHQA